MDITESRSRRNTRTIIAFCLIFTLVVVAIAVISSVKNTRDLQNILRESIQSKLIAISMQAREAIDVDAFASYNSTEDTMADRGRYGRTLTRLRLMADELGADYIYAIKEIGGKYYFVFDTDLDDTEIFIEYELSTVHREAFAGQNAADMMNVDDAYGSFNTGAVPIWKDGKVIGIVCTDTSDTYLADSQNTAIRNTVILVVALLVAMTVLLIVILRLLDRVRGMQDSLRKMAHYDSVTGLPNRHYLLDYLSSITKTKNEVPFALFFIDLDNFKSVNDAAGHDAGDELLQHIARYLENAQAGAHTFRPGAGRLNITARIGGDEFVVIVAGISTAEEAAATAQNLLDGFANKKIDRYIEKYGVGLSIGIALYPYHAGDFHVLISYADTAMYYAKRAGKNQYRIYTDEMHQANVHP
ncbi:GGDEF domain-containing protein [Eubacteriales bacterium OttesenSCG-928-A19]|nr:GGDEF domain-containing protein [Eubacteriales bacterium OttesenSCG-928-A19]